MNICPEEQNLWPPGGSETPGAELRARVGGASQHKDCLSSPEKVPLQSLCTAVGEGDPGSPHVSYRFSPSALSILKCSVCLRSFLGNKSIWHFAANEPTDYRVASHLHSLVSPQN